MIQSRSCTYCAHSFPLAAERCPHCAQPGLFPNVAAAEDPDECAALEQRYQAAHTEALTRGAETALTLFEAAIAQSQAVIARSVNETQRLATSDHELYATYYNLLDAGVRLPAGDRWDILRVVADSALFPGYKEHIRFAALSLDEHGLSHYGACSLVLHDEMIAHRASVLEENSVVFMQRHDMRMAEANHLPPGYRTTWSNRPRLCVAKMSRQIEATTQPAQHAALLLQQGTSSEADVFVEVHIWGPMTARTIKQVTVRPSSDPVQQVILKALEESLSRLGVIMQVRS